MKKLLALTPLLALLTPAAAAALDAATLRRVVPHKVVAFGKSAIPVSRLKLRRRA